MKLPAQTGGGKTEKFCEMPSVQGPRYDFRFDLFSINFFHVFIKKRLGGYKGLKLAWF